MTMQSRMLCNNRKCTHYIKRAASPATESDFEKYCDKYSLFSRFYPMYAILICYQ